MFWTSSFHLPCSYFTKAFALLQGALQEVIGWGLIGWKYYANVIGPIQCAGLASLGVAQIACAEKRFLILSRGGRVYTQAYSSDSLVGGARPAAPPPGSAAGSRPGSPVRPGLSVLVAKGGRVHGRRACRLTFRNLGRAAVEAWGRLPEWSGTPHGDTRCMRDPRS